jgi:hypothetical protein
MADNLFTSMATEPSRRVDHRQEAARLRAVAATVTTEAMQQHLEDRARQHDMLAGDATEKEIYSSSNGDRWYLVQIPATSEILVRHEPNRASGAKLH